MKRIFLYVRAFWATTLIMALFAGTGCRATLEQKGQSKETSIKNIDAIMKSHAEFLMSLDSVVGVYQGRTEGGSPCIRVMVVKGTPQLEEKIPKSLEGYPVEIRVTGKIEPMDR